MMVLWFEKFDFINDPYEKLDPYKIDKKYIVWNRIDLEEERKNLNRFIDDITASKRIALKIFGPVGAGKTWLIRVIEKEVGLKEDKIIFLYTKVEGIQPTFSVTYSIAIDYFIKNHLKKLIEYVSGIQEDTPQKKWEKLFEEDEDLANCFATIEQGADRGIAIRWLKGEKVTSGDLDNIGAINTIDSDYKRLEKLTYFIEKLSNIFPSVVLVIDELENAPMKLAGQLSDSLRDMLDSFSKNFSLIASFTAQKSEEWYDLGYTDALKTRIDYEIELESFKKESIVEILSLHNKVYRKEGIKVDNQLYPFTQKGIIKLLEMLPITRKYPRFLLKNCQQIVRTAAEKDVKEIDDRFVEENKEAFYFK